MTPDHAAAPDLDDLLDAFGLNVAGPNGAVAASRAAIHSYVEALRAERDALREKYAWLANNRNELDSQYCKEMARAEAAEAREKAATEKARDTAKELIRVARECGAIEKREKRLRDIVEKVTLAVCDTPVGSTSAEVKKRVLAALAQNGGNDA